MHGSADQNLKCFSSDQTQLIFLRYLELGTAGWGGAWGGVLAVVIVVMVVRVVMVVEAVAANGGSISWRGCCPALMMTAAVVEK